MPGAEVAFFKIADPSGFNDELTLVNYYSHGTDGNRIVESKIQRVVIVIPGLLRDCNNYENDVSEAKKRHVRGGDTTMQMVCHDEPQDTII